MRHERLTRPARRPLPTLPRDAMGEPTATIQFQDGAAWHVYEPSERMTLLVEGEETPDPAPAVLIAWDSQSIVCFPPAGWAEIGAAIATVANKTGDDDTLDAAISDVVKGVARAQ